MAFELINLIHWSSMHFVGISIWAKWNSWNTYINGEKWLLLVLWIKIAFSSPHLVINIYLQFCLQYKECIYFFSCCKTALTTGIILFVAILEKVLFGILIMIFFCLSFLCYFQQETGLGKTVNSFRKHATAGNVAKTLVKQWKKLISPENKR